MARIRTIKPSIFSSRTVSSWPRDVRWTFAGLMCYADDAGRGLDEARLIKAEVYPLDDAMTPRRIERHLDDICAGQDAPVCRYRIDGVGYLHFTKWGHQVINRPSRSKLPPCPIHDDGQGAFDLDGTGDSLSAHGGLTPGREGNKEEEGKRKGREGVRGSRRAAPEPPAEDPSPTQTLVAEWIDHSTPRPPGRVVGQVAREIKALLDEGQPYADVRAGLAAWARKGLHPSTLASVVHETRTTGGRRATTNDRVSDALALAARLAEQEQAGDVPQIGAAS